ncbi:MAG TPA: hypothetical protein PLG43_07315 [Spirochaetia bacterium]|nr:hypothetical protein [Spirochaetia bacterium]
MNRKTRRKKGKHRFLGAFFILAVLNLIAFVLTLSLPTGAFDRPEGGRTVIPGSYNKIEIEPMPLHILFTAPFAILRGETGPSVLFFCFSILCGGIANQLIAFSGIRECMASYAARIFGKHKHLFLAATALLFMAATSLFGAGEQLILFVIVVCPIVEALGWDLFTGLDASFLALSVGAAIPVSDPSSLGMAQALAGLPLFSGTGFRVICFCILYGLLILFLFRSAEKQSSVHNLKLDTEEVAPEAKNTSNNGKLLKASEFFLLATGCALIYVVVASVVPGLDREGAIAVSGLCFLLGSIGGALISGLSPARILSSFLRGAVHAIPAVILIAMAESIQYLLNRGGVMDTILTVLSDFPANVQPLAASIWVFGFSAIGGLIILDTPTRVFQHLPLILSLSGIVRVSRQSMLVGAFLGSGLSGILFPTAPILLSGLYLGGSTYPAWLRHIRGFTLAFVGVSVLLLILAQVTGLGPL